MAFKMRNSVIHGTRIHGEMLALNYDCCGDKPEDGRAASSAFQHTHADAPFMSNKFMGERNKAIKAGESSFTVDGKSYEVTGDKTPFEKGGCGNPTLGADNVNVQSPNAPYRYRNGYAFKNKHGEDLKHPLYGKLPSWAKKTFDGLSESDKKFQIENNKSESQILNALGDISGRTPKGPENE
tara:strand:+ start:4405 stop:4950 length:546 start_codon:yes stop_codon:yes gene_type:complete